MSVLPPMNAMRAFEAAARCGSFARAAAELHVTPAAVSQQIRNLEEMLGVKLFAREGRGIALTQAGAAGLDRLSQAFELVGEAAAAMRRNRPDRTLRISAPPGFSSKWLAPRLNRFNDAHPDIDIWIAAEDRVIDLDAGNVDLAIRYGRGGYKGLNAVLLLGEYVRPVCSPAFLRAHAGLDDPAALDGVRLLHDLSPESREDGADWGDWFASRGAFGVDAAHGARFDQSALALDAAIAGAGVALGRRALTHDDVVAGRLATIFAEGALALEAGYHFIWSRARRLSAQASVFADWLRAEAVRFEDELDQL